MAAVDHSSTCFPNGKENTLYILKIQLRTSEPDAFIYPQCPPRRRLAPVFIVG